MNDIKSNRERLISLSERLERLVALQKQFKRQCEQEEIEECPKSK